MQFNYLSSRIDIRLLGLFMRPVCSRCMISSCFDENYPLVIYGADINLRFILIYVDICIDVRICPAYAASKKKKKNNLYASDNLHCIHTRTRTHNLIYNHGYLDIDASVELMKLCCDFLGTIYFFSSVFASSFEALAINWPFIEDESYNNPIQRLTDWSIDRLRWMWCGRIWIIIRTMFMRSKCACVRVCVCCCASDTDSHQVQCALSTR